MKRQYQLTFVHKLLVGALLVLGILFLIRPDVYRKSVEGEQMRIVDLYYLQEGDYELKIDYRDSPADNAIVLDSNSYAGTDNVPGEFLVRQEIEAGEGTVRLSLHLDQGTHDIILRTEKNTDGMGCLQSVYLQKVQLLSRDHFFMSALCLFAALCVIVFGCFLSAERSLRLMALVGLGVLASLPFFSEALLTGDDLLYHLARLEGVYQGMRAGEFPVRINSIQTAGYGNLSAVMYPQLFLYPVALLRFVGVSLTLCYKILVVCMNVGTAMLTFYSTKHICKSDEVGYVASALYTFSMYRLCNVFFRAALGEALAMVFLPLVLWGIYEVLWGDHRKWYLLMLGVTGVLQSHLISTELCVFFLVLETVVWLAAKRFRGIGARIFAGVKAAMGSILLSASFLIPFLYYSGEDLQVFHMHSEVADSVAYFSQMFFTFPAAAGTNIVRGTTEGEMPIAVGSILLLGSILFCVMVLKKEKADGVGRSAVNCGKHCLCFGILSLFFASWLFPWDTLSQNELFRQWTTALQFSWRMLGPASLFLCMVSAVGIVWFAEEMTGGKWMYGVMLLLLITGTGYFFDSLASQREHRNDKMELEGDLASDSMYMYSEGEEFQALHLNYARQEGYVKLSDGARAVCSDYWKEGTHIWVQVSVADDTGTGEMIFPLYYYPGYEIRVNGEKVEVYSKDRLVACRLPKEDALVEVRYKGFAIFTVADIVTFLSVLGMAGYAIRRRLKKVGKVLSK